MVEQLKTSAGWNVKNNSSWSGTYGSSYTTESLDSIDTQPTQNCRISLPMDPHSMNRVIWNIAGLLFVVYDAVMIPLSLMVLSNVASWDLIMDLVTNMYW